MPRISGNVMTLTGVCKGLSIVAFLAGLRFRLNISIIITSIIVFLAGLRFGLKISITITQISFFSKLKISDIADFINCLLGLIQKEF